MGALCKTGDIMSKRRTWRWLTRDQWDKNDPHFVIFIWDGASKPRKARVCHKGAIDWEGQGDSSEVCAHEFELVTGIVIPTDRPIKVDFGGCKVVE
jgi:hypothetical protein